MIELLINMVTDKQYVPEVRCNHGHVCGLKFSVGKFICTISSADTTAEDNIHLSLNEKNYIPYHNADDEFYETIINKDNLSVYNDQAIEVMEKYKLGPLSGYFEKY